MIRAPHLSFLHAEKEPPSRRKQARTASHTGALSDMRKHGLSNNGGSTGGGDALRNLTIKGLEAASWELRRPKPNLARLAGDPPHVQAAAQAAVDTPPGIGAVASLWTEVPLPATGTWKSPGKGGAQADLVLTVPQDGVPLLFMEVDNCHETPEEYSRHAPESTP
ncbi:hypothetical protein [Streptomyces sp. NPDC055107]